MPRKQVQPKPKKAEELRIFVSHKGADQEFVADFMKTLLKHDIEPRRISYYISSFDMSIGRHWDKEIQEKMQDSQWLILIFTSPEKDWNWCLYEAGYFTVYVEKDPSRRIFCIHHPDVPVPTPFERWQNISADKTGIKRLVKSLYKSQPDGLGLYPKLFTEKMKKEKKKLYNELHNLFSKRVATKPFVGNCWLTIPKDELPVLQSGEVPEKAPLSFDDMGKRIFEIGGVEGEIDWKTFLETYLKPDQEIWRSKLVRVLQKALKTEVESTFALISDANRKDFYRPILEEMQYRFNGDITFKFSFIRIPTYFNPDSDNKLDRLFHLLNVQQNFRWRIIEGHGKEFEEHIARKKFHEEESFSTIEKQLMEDFKYDLAECIQDARNRGLRSEKGFLELFEKEDRKRVKQITERGTGICEEEINRPAEKVRLEDFLKSIYELEKLNSKFRKILARTYKNAFRASTAGEGSLNTGGTVEDEKQDGNTDGSY